MQEEEEASLTPDSRHKEEISMLASGPRQTDGSRAGLRHGSGSHPGFVTDLLSLGFALIV